MTIGKLLNARYSGLNLNRSFKKLYLNINYILVILNLKLGCMFSVLFMYLSFELLVSFSSFF